MSTRDGGNHMRIVRVPPSGRAKAHLHAGHETAIYALSVQSRLWYGERLEQHSANVSRLSYNPSKTETCVALVARTNPNEQESGVMLPELEGPGAATRLTSD